MSDRNLAKVHWSFWLIAIFMLIWNGLGSANFIVQMNPEMVSSYRETEQAIIQGRPLWATVGFGISVFGGAVGCILLLLRNTSAFYVFVASLIGTFIAIGHSLTSNINFGIGEIIGIVVMPIFISVLLIWYSNFSNNKGWLKTHNNLSKRDAVTGAPS